MALSAKSRSDNPSAGTLSHSDNPLQMKLFVRTRPEFHRPLVKSSVFFESERLPSISPALSTSLSRHRFLRAATGSWQHFATGPASDMISRVLTLARLAILPSYSPEFANRMPPIDFYSQEPHEHTCEPAKPCRSCSGEPPARTSDDVFTSPVESS